MKKGEIELSPKAWGAAVMTLFPESYPSVLGVSLIGKALREGLWDLSVVDLKEFGIGKHKKVDDEPYGGGHGMIIRAEVIARAVEYCSDKPGPLVMMSPRGKLLTQEDVVYFSRQEGIKIICGRYEGIDERVIQKYNIREVSIGDFILSGGEVASLCLLEAVVRNLSGVIGKSGSLLEESHINNLLEYPQYTRPRSWRGISVPTQLLSGNHACIKSWRDTKSRQLTKKRRPDLWQKFCDTTKDTTK